MIHSEVPLKVDTVATPMEAAMAATVDMATIHTEATEEATVVTSHTVAGVVATVVVTKAAINHRVATEEEPEATPMREPYSSATSASTARKAT
jgi:hypothetical protein